MSKRNQAAGEDRLPAEATGAPTPSTAAPPDGPPPRPRRRKPKPKSKADLLSEIVQHRTDGRAHYEAADLLLNELLGQASVGERITHPTTGEVFEVVDNFATTNKVFRAHGIARYELKAVKGTKPVSVPLHNGQAE